MSTVESIRPAVINTHTTKVRGYTYIGRWSSTNLGKYGNPILFFRPCLVCGQIHDRTAQGREQLLKCYRKWIWKKIKEDPETRRSIRALRGEEIGCHCAPLPCHGDVLADCCVWLWSDEGLRQFPLEDE